MFEAPVTTEVSNKILTVPNVISCIRLCMIPVCFYFLLQEDNVLAALLFAIAAATDFLDGLIARSTNTVTKLGQLLDPIVDRGLMIFGVVGLVLVNRLPLWIVILILLRDGCFLIGGGYIFKRYGIRIPVIYLGKFVTTLLFIGFAGLILNMPLVAGLGICDLVWLPGFNNAMVSWGIWFVYVGLLLGIITTAYYLKQAFSQLRNAKETQVMS